jgi:hypothetical protein
MKAIFVLRTWESKRLIAKGVVSLPEVKSALKKGYIIVSMGSTDAYVAEELLGETIDKGSYMAGLIHQGRLQVLPKEERLPLLILKDGHKVEIPFEEALDDFRKGDVLIKGGNALDPQGNVGILMAASDGGTIGKALGIITARGSHYIAPVGLEKLIPSVREATKALGIETIDYSMGHKVGLMPVVGAKVFTEIEALNSLFNVEAVHVASGGVGDSEGSVVLAVSGDEACVKKAIELIEGIKEEEPLRIE